MTVYSPAPYSGHAADLPRYIQQELQTIARAFDKVTGAATLYRSAAAGPGPVWLLGALPLVLDDFDSVTPVRAPAGVAPSIPSTLYVRDGGLWALSFAITATGLAPSSAYEVRLFRDDAPLDLFAIVTTENQTTEATFSAIGILRVNLSETAGRFDLRISETSGVGGNWQTLGAYFSAWKVGA